MDLPYTSPLCLQCAPLRQPRARTAFYSRSACLPTTRYTDSDNNTPSLLLNDFTHTHTQSQIQDDIYFKSTFHLESPHQRFLFNMLFEIPCFKEIQHMFLGSLCGGGGGNCKRRIKGMIMAHKKRKRKQKKNLQNT